MRVAEHLLLLDGGPTSQASRRFSRIDPGFGIHPVAVRPELARYIDSICIIAAAAPLSFESSESLQGRTALDVLPGTKTSLCVSYGARFSRPNLDGVVDAPSSVCGIFGQTRSYLPSSGSGVVMITFRPGGLRRFVPASADELANAETLAEDVWGRDSSLLDERVAEAASHAMRGALVQEFLLERLGPGGDPLVSRVAQSIVDDGGATPIRALADAAGMSERQLERRFVSAVGTRPKHFARLARFHRALAVARTGLGWAEVAFQSGFSDQSHLTREFVALAGATPEVLASRPRVPIAVAGRP